MPALELLLDILLCLGLVGLAWGALGPAGLFRSIVMFIVYGLFVSLVWARLSAPDVALAEAAIGAGLTGALFLVSGRSISWAKLEKTRVKWLPAVAAAATGAIAAAALVPLANEGPSLTAAVEARLPETGVSQAVTAVLLNFRGFDTWLELAVLLVALLGAWSMAGETEPKPPAREDHVLLQLVRFIGPVGIVVAVYLLWAGTKRPGGAFQAGAILGATGVLFLLGGFRLPLRDGSAIYRLTATVGFAAFLAVGAWSLISGASFLRYPPEWASALVLAIETLSVASIALTLTSLFALAGAGRGLD